MIYLLVCVLCLLINYQLIAIKLTYILTKMALNISTNRPYTSSARFFKALALWADAFYKTKYTSVCPSMCFSVHF